ncbi:hypothetical protein Tcan_06968 [Toxocara canis]|uniref:Major sperm protein n=1 Tax=Toxocara canis TaxID=6265 RepID=A0A0B2VYE3_TOXCA|nr:hypothetical protein Tcan_06968 [Toxocara canis]
MQADQIRSFTVTPLAEKASLYAYALRSDGSHEDFWVPANCSSATMAISEETAAALEGDVMSVPTSGFQRTVQAQRWRFQRKRLQHLKEMSCLFRQKMLRNCNSASFKEPYRGIVDLAIWNRRKRSLMWALKSSAPSRLMARPTCGVLAPRSTVNMKLGVLEPDAVNAETRDDILAFVLQFH